MSGPKFERNPYELLGVNRRATTAEIRQAYLHLLKTNHPDLAQPGAAQDAASAYVVLLNLAYATLRDEQERAACDLELAKLERSTKVPDSSWDGSERRSVVRSPANVARRAATKDAREVARFLFGFLAVLAFVGSAYWLDLSGAIGSSLLAAPHADAADRDGAELANDPTILADAQRLSQIALTMSPRDALAFSRRCYENASLDGDNYRSIVDCVIFDDAVVIASAGRLASLPTHFQSQWLTARHVDALSFFHHEDRALDIIRTMTSRALVAQFDKVSPLTQISPSGEQDKVLLAAQGCESGGELNADDKSRVPIRDGGIVQPICN